MLNHPNIQHQNLQKYWGSWRMINHPTTNLMLKKKAERRIVTRTKYYSATFEHNKSLKHEKKTKVWQKRKHEAGSSRWEYRVQWMNIAQKRKHEAAAGVRTLTCRPRGRINTKQHWCSGLYIVELFGGWECLLPGVVKFPLIFYSVPARWICLPSLLLPSSPWNSRVVWWQMHL